MAAQKRPLDESSSTQNLKKSRTAKATNSLLTEEVDFPRGGGTSFTPLEIKAIRAEAVKEADTELFKDSQGLEKSKKRKRKLPASSTAHAAEGKDRLRIEHLNYKRINVGMKIFGQVINILPLALIVSLPNQLFAHVPITNISTQFTELLERMESQDFETNLAEDGEEEEDGQSKLQVPELSDMFKVGQYVRTVVSAVHPLGASDTSGIGRSRDEAIRASKRVELCLIPERVNSGVQKSDLKSGFTLTAAVKSQEDHGYILDFGIPDISGFLSFPETKDPKNETKLHVGVLLDVTVIKVSGNGRTCTVSADHTTFTSSHLSEISSVSSILPGTLVQASVTASHSSGLSLLVLGYFEGTVDPLHLRNEASAYKIGKKIKARILYHYSSSSPPKFALALTEHVVNLTVRQVQDKDEEIKKTKVIQNAYPVGTLLEAVKVLRIEPERGLVVEVEPGLEGFAHISQTSDDHIPSLSINSHWKSGSIHQARVIGYFALDGLLQLSLKPSVIQQKYFQINDVEVGEVIKGTVKKLTDSALFVSLSGGIDGVVWPNHYADITLKHPAKRFQVGASIRCRVLVVDPDRERISLTAKKSLVDSSLPIFSRIEDFATGMVTHAVVFKVHEKHLLVEFYNNLKAVVPAKEISDSPNGQLPESFPVGRVVRVRILSLHDGRITASIRQVTANRVVDLSSIEIGHTVEGSVSEVHKDNAILALEPSHIRALLSLKNLANHRGLTLPQLRTGLKVGEKLEELVVVTRNAEKAFVIVANKPKPKAGSLLRGSTITMESVEVGQLIGGRVTRHSRHGALVKITTHIGAVLHATDTSDSFEAGISLPGIDTIIKAIIIEIDKTKRQLTLSTRRSRMHPSPDQVIADREISGIEDIQVGETLRGFVKNIGEHGLFVTIARNVDARVQIKELFDEYIKDWKGQFRANQLVKGRVLSVDISAKKVEMTLRSGDPLTRRESSGIFITHLKEGQKVEGVVKKIEDYGLFIQINGSKINGLCHKSQLSDNPDADVTLALRGFREGDRVKAIILSIDKRRISLGLKPSYFTEEELEDVNDELLAEDPQASNMLVDDAFAAGSEHNDDDGSSSEEHHDSMDVGLVLDETQTGYHPTQAPSIPQFMAPSSLPLAGGFHWSGDGPSLNEDEEADLSEDESDVAERPSKKKRRRKEIEQDLTSEMHTKTPESNADFERVLLGSPNSSYLWIQYMSFQLPLSELDKAREIARRAIQTINFREEKERLNVWIALLNLENVYGTEDSLQAVFKEAARANDSKTVHLRLASIFDQAGKREQAEEQYKRTCKKFGSSSKVWTLFGEYHLRRGNVEEARKLLPRSLQGLEKQKHLKTVSRFAQLEYKHGDPERGKTLFEGIIDSHSKRWDMWSVYIDMEATQGNIQALRNIFDRVLAFKMTSHKAKFFFKKWFELEKRMGDVEGTETVKVKAIEWTQRASNAS